MKKKLLIFLVIIILLVSSLILYSKYIEPEQLKTNEIKITVENLDDNYYGFKIVHLSDIHYGSTINEKEFNKVILEINKLKPDIVLLTGDLFDTNYELSVEEYDKVTEQLKSINASIGKYAITGENDNTDKWDDIIAAGEFMNINDTSRLIYNNSNNPILISGISSNTDSTLSIEDKIKPINDYISSLTIKPIYSILLIHEPDYIDKIDTSNFNLILAGHSLGGLINLPFVGPILKLEGATKYINNHFEINNSKMYVSNGLGTSKYKFRFNNKPSINLFRLTKTS